MTCPARTCPDGQIRCDRCRLVMDRDEWDGECRRVADVVDATAMALATARRRGAKVHPHVAEIKGFVSGLPFD